MHRETRTKFTLNDSFSLNLTHKLHATDTYMHSTACSLIEGSPGHISQRQQYELPCTLTEPMAAMETCKWRRDGWLKVKGHGLSGKCHPLRKRVIWSPAPALFQCLFEACEKVKVRQASSLQIALSKDWFDVTKLFPF